MPTLQVPLTEEEMSVVKKAADYRGMKLRALVSAWVEAGCPLADGPSNGELMAGNGEVMVGNGSEHLELARRQVALLERLVELQESGTLDYKRSEQESGTPTPHGGPQAASASGSASGNGPRISGFRGVDPSDPFGSGVAVARREPTQPVPGRPWLGVKEEPDLDAIKPLEAGRKLYLEDGWALFRTAVAVEVEMADGSVLEARSEGRTDTAVALRDPVGGWPGGDGNRGLVDVCASVSAVKFLEAPDLKDGSAMEQLGGES